MTRPTRELNRALVAVSAELTGTRYCRACNRERPLAGGHKPPGRTPWRCATCHGHHRAGPGGRR